MAPPKRKSGGRVTPKGTRPGDRVTTKPPAKKAAGSGDHVEGSSVGASESRQSVGSSSRYTPPIPEQAKHSPPWVPYLMLAFLALGGLMIILRYTVFTDTNWPTLIGLVFILGGLYTATKWR